MKKTLLTMIVAMTLNLGFATAVDYEADLPGHAKAITNQIYSLLSDNNIPDAIRGHKAEVRIAVDRGNYLRILSIETESDALEDFIRNRIDFQKLRKGTCEKDVVYRIPIEVKK